ncbi:MAG: hypothetical protein RLZZ600_822 [Actinomycetota bacterium]
MAENSWGRVDATGTVFVRDTDGEREVGAFPDATADEALAYFVRKFDDLAVSINLLERRISTGSAVNDLVKALDSIKKTLAAGIGVGDFAGLRIRVAALDEKLAGAKGVAEEHRQAAREEALANRTLLVEQIEAIASSNLNSVNWKSTTAKVDELFASWQASQKSSVKLPKEQADELWKRFRNARSTIDRARRAHFATVDTAGKEVKARKEKLIAAAEALANVSDEKTITAYRALLEEWKQAGRASKKVDDALWTKFKAAGDALYSAKAAKDAAEDESFSDNLVVKEKILADGQELLTITDRDKARALLSSLQKRWDAAGKVPRAKVKEIEAGMRKLEMAVKKLDDDAWSSSDPEKQARQEGLAGAIATKISKLEIELASATAAKDSKKITELTEAIQTQKSWLVVVSN